MCINNDKNLREWKNVVDLFKKRKGIVYKLNFKSFPAYFLSFQNPTQSVGFFIS
jgi:hypothetical protein